MKLSYSAPGKIILSGEHAVVYGKPALVSAINLGLTFELTANKLRPDLDPAIKHIKSVVIHYLQKNNIAYKEKPFAYDIKSNIPIGRGMGSSAALCVAASAGLLHYFTGQEQPKEVVNSVAYITEKYFHTNPSGVDVSASCHGGLIYFRKEFEFLKTISSLNFKIPKKFQEKLILIDTGQPQETTKEMVELVGKTYNDQPKKTSQVINEIEKITKRMVISITTENEEMFKDCIIENEALLEDLGVVSKQTQELLNELKSFGVGKITGAGGKKDRSGLIIFMTNDVMEVKQFLIRRQLIYLDFKSSNEGFFMADIVS